MTAAADTAAAWAHDVRALAGLGLTLGLDSIAACRVGLQGLTRVRKLAEEAQVAVLAGRGEAVAHVDVDEPLGVGVVPMLDPEAVAA